MDELDVTLELLQEKAQLVRSLRRLGYGQDEVTAEALHALRAEMEMLLFMLAGFCDGSATGKEGC